LAGAVVTPGFAQPRSKLPWLPYGEQDRVIINAHNFTPAVFDPSINGKTPIVAWVPSQDDSGNGTATLSALVGSVTGALTSMDPATDWVADTGAGGARRIDMDGSNDYILSSAQVNVQQRTMNIWVYLTSLPGSSLHVCGRVNGLNSLIVEGNIVVMSSGKVYGYCFDSAQRDTSTSDPTTVSINTWTMLSLTLDGTNAKAWINGVEVGSVACTTPDFSSVYTAPNLMVGGRSAVSMAGAFGAFRWDDFCLWDQALTGSDLVDLYASGAGRGNR
jgi:hypothetical protein